MSEFVTIATGLDLQEAYLIRARLEGSGIDCFLVNEHMVTLRHPIFFADGVELRVLKDDAQAAMEVLSGSELDEECELEP